MIVTDTRQLNGLRDLVHDCWFNVEKIVFNEGEKTVAIRLEKKKANLDKDSKSGINLLIRNVEALTITDTEQVRDYDLNEIEFNAASRRLVITGGIPITIELVVSLLNVEATTAA